MYVFCSYRGVVKDNNKFGDITGNKFYFETNQLFFHIRGFSSVHIRPMRAMLHVLRTGEKEFGYT